MYTSKSSDMITKRKSYFQFDTSIVITKCWRTEREVKSRLQANRNRKHYAATGALVAARVHHAEEKA